MLRVACSRVGGRQMMMVARAAAVRRQTAAMSSYFAKSHEYLTLEGEVGTVGITSHAAGELGDIVFVDLPAVGDEVTAGEVFGAVESVKAASDVYSPVSGIVTEINETLETNPSLVNESAQEEGWFIKVKVTDADLDAAKKDLLAPEDYEKLIA